jgi:beta-1,4-mannosyl-glycoprotein beta-1,4-N-acetylglucosaminyltransferase
MPCDYFLKSVKSPPNMTLHLKLDHGQVFDLSLYNGEAFHLLIRLRTLSRFVTRFLIGHSQCTFSGRHGRPLTFAPYEFEIAAFGDLLRPVYLDLCSHSIPWGREGNARLLLMAAVLTEKGQPDDLVIMSDADEYIDPAVLLLLKKNPPAVAYRLFYHAYYYSLRWQFYDNWTRPEVYRFDVLKNTSLLVGNYPIFPIIAGVHCSYCFNSVQKVIHKLETFSHVEFSHGHWVDPVFIVAKVACGRRLFDDDRNIIYLAPPNPRFLDLPPGMDWMLWRMPFMDLPELHLDPRAVLARADCNPDLKVANGTLQPYR